MRIIQITEQQKMELGELGEKVVRYMHEFLECLDKTTGGEISQEMAERYGERYGERRGVRGTGRYGRREGGYGERRGVPGSGRYGRREGGYGERGSYGEHYPEDEYDERSGGYNTRYDY